MTLHVEAAANRRADELRPTFSNGRAGMLERWRELFEPLGDVAVFEPRRVARGLRTRVWPDGAGLAPEHLDAAAA